MARTPVDPASPWPQFRGTADQRAASPLVPVVDNDREPWRFFTGKGVFSTPVIDGRGTAYVGSADHTFYAIDRGGDPAWSFETGGIIDSAALLDDRGRVYVPSGDGILYALDRHTGEEVWRFEADPPAGTGAFIDWFEGNVAMGADGTLYVPNDNFCLYAVDRDTGEPRWCHRFDDQIWSSPAVDVDAGRLYVGNNFPFADNVAALDAATGDTVWTATAQGSVAASPVLTAEGLVVVGGFDGMVRALDAGTGEERWRFGARDHIYASPAQAPDGTIVQPSADGTVYGLDPTTGARRWSFDTLEPLRSSPAVAGDGTIYLGSGEGRLLALGPDGTRRWSMLLVDGDRNDLNASPALGPDGVVIAGESGEVFGVPYDWCLSDAGRHDPRCRAGAGGDLPDGRASVLFTTRFGRRLPDPPAEIDANQPLAFTLLLREGADTRLTLLDSPTVSVTTEPALGVDASVSGDRRFVAVSPPPDGWAGVDGGTVSVRVRGGHLVDPDRDGLRFTGGRPAGAVDESFSFRVRPHREGGPELAVPDRGGAQSVVELSRFAAPLPTILPSYNQIGFDSIHYLLGAVARAADGRLVAWAVGARPGPRGGAAVVDPASRVRFPLELDQSGELLTFENRQGFTIEFNGFPLPFDRFDVATRVRADGSAVEPASMRATVVCGRIDFYGPFLQQLGYCNPETDRLEVFGGAQVAVRGVASMPGGVGRPVFASEPGALTVTVSGSEVRLDEHAAGLLVVDAATGRPLPLAYTRDTEVDGVDGALSSVRLAVPPGDAGRQVRAHLMVDMFPAASAELTLG